MCLGVPGRVTSIEQSASGPSMGAVDFAGIRKEVCLDCVPGVKIGDFVIVHVGFAIGRVDEAEAATIFASLERMGELGELDIPQPG
jgi:hydrogenase expression/formation protein HypC